MRLVSHEYSKGGQTHSRWVVDLREGRGHILCFGGGVDRNVLVLLDGRLGLPFSRVEMLNI